jgi:hypothetical protein
VVGSSPTVQEIDAKAADEPVVPGSAFQMVVAVIALKEVVGAIADEGVIEVGSGDVLDVPDGV